MKKYIILIMITIAFATVVTYYFKNKTHTCGENINQVKIDDKVLDVMVSDNDELRQKGLSNHKRLRQNEAMLFIFDYDVTPGFWMKDMLFPIHIFWIDNNNFIIGVVNSALPESYPSSFHSEIPIRFVLETSIQFDKNPELMIGKKMEILCK